MKAVAQKALGDAVDDVAGHLTALAKGLLTGDGPAVAALAEDLDLDRG